MHPDLAKLVVLQAHDLEAKRLRDHMAALVKNVAALEARAKATVGQRAVIVDLIAKEDALRRKEESDVADLKQKLERTKKKLDMTTTTHQLEALEHEAAFARSEISRIEDAELESMERGETLEAQLKLADAAVADAAATFERERARAVETAASDHTALLEIERERTALRAEIVQSETGEASLANYDRIARGKGTAVSEALNQKCTACQMMVRPQRWNDLRDNSRDAESAHTIFSCENCGRMLFYDPARDSPARKPVQVESIAAQIVRSL
ncbi:MAG: C4-type zinc ribbon domain-containing protein [Acidobacteriota bacterium]|nr:C4-type zinc ribbon domain-containing protein [Acidobacteriota bacterium]